MFDLDGFTMYESFSRAKTKRIDSTCCSVPRRSRTAKTQNDDENDDATEIDPDDEIEALMTSENVESLKNAPRKPSAVNDAADDDFRRRRSASSPAPARSPGFAEGRGPSSPRASRDRSNDAKNDNNDIDDIYA